MRIVFMGSPQTAVHSLTDLVRSGFDIAAVYTQPDRPAGRGRGLALPAVKIAALSLGLPVIQTESLKSPEAVEQLAALRPDIVVVCAFGQILTQAVLDIPPLQCINVHFSLLPRHRGAYPVAASILAGDSFTGVTLQLIRKKLDSGPVLSRAAVPVRPEDDTGTLTEKLASIGAAMLLESLTGWMRGEIEPRQQDENAATYFGQIKKEAGEIDWKLSAIEIWRRVRAYNPWPGAYTFWRGRQLRIRRAIPLSAPAELYGNGRIIGLNSQPAVLGIGTGDGILGILEMQLEGKKAMTAAEFINGQRDFIGDVLPC